MTVSKSRRRRGGFTLIEVLLVLVILVTLASLAVTTFDGISRRAKINAAKVQLGLFKGQLDLYKMSLNWYPSTQQGLAALCNPPTDLVDPGLWDGPYTEKIPYDPWDQEYRYQCPGTNADYDLWSAGPDLQDNTEDDIGNWQQ